jgi:hypothetical protein
MNTPRSRIRPFSLALALAAAATLGGCAMPNSSNPTLSITRAQVRGDRATLDMQVDNPSDMDVQLDAVHWTLQYGPLPTADGSWTLGVPVESKGQYTFTKEIVFSTPSLDPSADQVELAGTMDVTTLGDTGETSLKGAGFVAKSKTRR